jgi:hypothetical protein
VRLALVAELAEPGRIEAVGIDAGRLQRRFVLTTEPTFGTSVGQRDRLISREAVLAPGDVREHVGRRIRAIDRMHWLRIGVVVHQSLQPRHDAETAGDDIKEALAAGI